MKIIDGAKFAVTEIAKPSNQWTIQHSTDNWEEERPSEKLDSSGSFNGFTEEMGIGVKENDKSKIKSILKGK